MWSSWSGLVVNPTQPQPVSVALGVLTAEEFAALTPEDQQLAEEAVQYALRARGESALADPEARQNVRENMQFFLASYRP